MKVHAFCRLAGAALALLGAQELRSQTAYKYDVVSIHKAEPGQQNSGFSPGPQGGLKARNVTTLGVISFSYHVADFQIEGAPPWAKSERFEISFTPDRSEEMPAQGSVDGWLERHRQRMQSVLKDRFELAHHMETRELPSYVLTAAKGGHKLGAAAHPENRQTVNINNGRQLIATTAPLKALAEALAMILGKPVRDETGIEGTFDFKVEWQPDPGMPLSRSAEDDTGRASIFTALTEQLGLRVESRKGPVPVLVIDKIERPSEN